MGMILLCDMDGVIVDFEAAFYAAWRLRYPDRFRLFPDERRQWDLVKDYPPEFENDINALIREPGFFRSMKPMPGAVAALHDMLGSGINVRLCTAPMREHPTCAQEKIVWIERYLGHEFVNRTIITRDKTLIRGDFLLDDKHEVTSDTEGAPPPEWEHVYFETPYTRHLTNRRKANWSNWREMFEAPR